MNNNRWMSTTAGIDLLTLSQLVLPGAHNSGVDKKATYSAPGIAHWVACQNNSFYEQLQNGARVLDARIEYERDSRGVGTFWFQHNGYRSSRSLENLVMQVRRFLQENPDEFIVLDFHDLKQPFDYKEFNRFMLTHLGDQMIPVRNQYLSLGELKQQSRVQRVWVAAFQHPQLDQNRFMVRIKHEWSGITDASAEEVQAHITQVMNSPPSSYSPWSLSATSYSNIGGPVDIKEYLNRWFDPAKKDWVYNCNIINVDFIEESNLVKYCSEANFRNARRLIDK
ncbi:phospholipase [Pseudomonas sp. MYb118]|uniref:phospholipase n=1 Tax=Pseudomonas sp. MYb118 TaxID=1848720 RepID=UPI0034CF3728